MLSVYDIFGITDPNKRPAATPDPKKGQYDDILPAYTQVSAYGKDFENKAAVRQYEAKNGLTKNCPHCYNDSVRRCYCSTCGGTGKVPINYGVY